MLISVKNKYQKKTTGRLDALLFFLSKGAIMNKQALLHRPESEYAFVYDNLETLHVRLRTAKDDIKTVTAVFGDKFDLQWQKKDWNNTARLPLEKTLTTDRFDYWMVKLPAPTHRLSYAFIIEDYQGEKLVYCDQGIFSVDFLQDMPPYYYFVLPYFHDIDRFKAPDWVRKTVWYQIFPERFANGDKTNDHPETKAWNSLDNPGRFDYYGGDLRGIIDHLDHLVDLGVNGIYFNPIFKAATNHKYDTIDYYQIDPEFGTNEDFQELVQKAHAKGIKIMLDAVFNHIGDNSPQWQDVIKNGPKSKYYDWFHVKSWPISYTETEDFEYSPDCSYETFAFTPHMPKWNTANPEVKQYLIDIACYWIKEYDIDAWRLDVADEIDHQFWKEFKKQTTAIKPDLYILGEIWASSQRWLDGDEFHAVMNYSYTAAILDHFVHKQINANAMVSRLNEQLMLYRKQTNEVMFNVLDSHDAPRIKTLAHDNSQLVKQTMAFEFMQQGVPSIYYGTEYGMTGKQDPDNRKPMCWDESLQDHVMYAFTKKLVAFRKEYADLLTKGDLIWVNVDDEKSIIEMKRQYQGQIISALFNTGNTTIAVDLTENDEVLLTNSDQKQLLPDQFIIKK